MTGCIAGCIVLTGNYLSEKMYRFIAADMLKAAGYRTNMTGKWHLANDKPEAWPLQRGFDEFYGHLAGTCDFFHLHAIPRK